MGGRGSSSGLSKRNGTAYPYGTEYKTITESGNIKFVEANDNSGRVPMETQTKNRIYVTVKEDMLKSISYYDKEGKRFKQIDLYKPHKGVLPHTHHGYEHNENDSIKGYSYLTPEEKRMVENVREIWYNFNK